MENLTNGDVGFDPTSNDSPRSNLINPLNISLYHNMQEMINAIPGENIIEIDRYQRILHSLSRFPLPLNEINDFLWLNGMDRETAESLIKITGKAEFYSNLSEFKKQRLNEARQFCKILLTTRHLIPRSLSPKTSQISHNESPKRLYMPPFGSSSWTALIILFILNTNTRDTEFRLSELLNLSEVISKVDLTGLSKLIKSNLITFRNDVFKKKKSKETSDKPKRFMTKLADMYNYSITEDGKSIGRKLIVKVKVPIQSLIDSILSNYHSATLPKSIKSFTDVTRANPSDELLSLNKLDDEHEVEKDSDYTIKRGPDPTLYERIMIDESIKSRKSDNIKSTIPNLDIFIESLRGESDNVSDYRLSLSPNDLSPDYNTSKDYDNDCTFDDGNFHLAVVIDNREFGGARLKYQDLLIDILKGENIKYKIFTLPLGDVVWVCHRSCPNNSKHKNGPFGGETYVLNWIVERKTASDLHSSILDGRYDDQRQRLLESGIKNIIYLYENFEPISGVYWKKHVNPKIFLSAKLNIQFINGFNVINTSSPSHTFHKHLESLICNMSGIKSFKNITSNENERLSMWLKNPDNSCTWDNWVLHARKDCNITYKHIFGKQLRCIPSCGPIAIAAILSKWPSPSALASALAEDEDAISVLVSGRKKIIGKKVLGAKLGYTSYSKIIQVCKLI